ncbi:MAG: Uma2 family endonuclease [Gammaproteobacteria bacterium]
MTPAPAGTVPPRRATEADIAALPEHLVGEILDGVLYTQPRPAGPHSMTETRLSADLDFGFSRGRGGPGGWWILVEPELHLGKQILVPDIAGWRRERMPRIPDDHRFTVSPDWVCEILSPSTVRKDRVQKMRIYAEQGVPHCWLLDPLARTLEVFTLQGGRWLLHSTFDGDARFRATPFEAVEFELGAWWVPDAPEEAQQASLPAQPP